MQRARYGALQYVLVKPCCAIVTFVSGAAGLYGACARVVSERV
jgi:hypothetical protein